MDHLFLYQDWEPAVIPLIPLGLYQSTTNLTDKKLFLNVSPFTSHVVKLYKCLYLSS